MAVGDIYRLRLKMMVIGGMPIYTYWHFKAIGAGKAINLCNLWTGSASLDWSRYSFMVSDQVKLLSAQAIQINAGGLDTAEVAAAPTLVGKVGGPVMPLEVCGRINWRTAINDRRHRGATYLAGLSSLRHSGGYWNQAQIDNVNAWLGNWLGAYGPTGTGVNWRFGVYSRKIGGNPPNANPAGWTQVTGYSFQPLTYHLEKKKIDHASQYPQPYI